MTEERLPTVTEFPSTVVAAGDPRGTDATRMLLPVDTRRGQDSQYARIHEPDQQHDTEATRP